MRRTYSWLFVIIVLLAACSWFEPPAPVRSFRAADLLVPPTYLPTTWTLEGPSRPTWPCHRSDDCVILGFVPPVVDVAAASHEVYRFQTLARARETYAALTTLSMPEPGWSFSSATADESSLRCFTTAEQHYRCGWTARYAEIVVAFRVTFIPGEFELADMERVVREIDALMVARLGKGN